MKHLPDGREIKHQDLNAGWIYRILSQSRWHRVTEELLYHDETGATSFLQSWQVPSSSCPSYDSDSGPTPHAHACVCMYTSCAPNNEWIMPRCVRDAAAVHFLPSVLSSITRGPTARPSCNYTGEMPRQTARAVEWIASNNFLFRACRPLSLGPLVRDPVSFQPEKTLASLLRGVVNVVLRVFVKLARHFINIKKTT